MIHGFENSEDAAVYELDEHNYLVNTVDFFTPIHHDPYIFGQITAANAVSDVFAMGGNILNCLNVLAFPNEIEPEVITEILKGAMDKVNEAGGVIAGGHTISTDHIIYGLSVNGTVPKGQLKTNDGAKTNQKIILTKKIGTGIYSKEININKELEDCKEVVESMTTLNKKAAKIIHKYAVSAVTDVTGFGLLGHLSEVAKASKVSANIYMDRVPLFERTRKLCIEYANGGMVRNVNYFGKYIEFTKEAKTQENINILFDPQTSGGLMIFVDEDDCDGLLRELHQEGILQATVIGETGERSDKLIKVHGR
ncbi:Selenide water dikinase protein [Haloplasma contractile SSD-17B]|uniref:Selenide water dikinase protein n=1 Tax=Haloplasma contractile SSD-17B TaxID=1033810 RepID=U2FK76_9MOLU|nr:Selenide water dikinase protein [Haloplasma contractile SSD-17B]